MGVLPHAWPPVNVTCSTLVHQPMHLTGCILSITGGVQPHASCPSPAACSPMHLDHRRHLAAVAMRRLHRPPPSACRHHRWALLPRRRSSHLISAIEQPGRTTCRTGFTGDKWRKLARIPHASKIYKLRGRIFLTSGAAASNLNSTEWLKIVIPTPTSVAAAATSPPRHADGRRWGA